MSPLSSLSLANARKDIFYKNIRSDVFIHFPDICKIYNFIGVFIIFLWKK